MPKNIVICCDGTSNDVTGDVTNVFRTFRSLVRGDKQLAFYDSGVGTLADPAALTTFGKRLSKKLDMGMGLSVRENVCEAYQFLCRNYEPNDKIFLFGFSRGAYTVRCLAGMMHFLGLVPRELEGLNKLGWTIYADDDQELPVAKRFGAADRFKDSFPVNPKIRIHFVGVWDTVSSFGWFWNMRTAPYTSNNPSISNIRHAVSIDEHRACFRENLFRPRPVTQHDSFKQVWFPGVHADVGGGYPDQQGGLSKIALQWMINEARDCDCLFDDEQIDRFLGRSAIGDEQIKSQPDVTAPVHKSTKGLWHVLEFLPRKQWDHEAKKGRMRWFGPNRYRRRKIPIDADLHPSVQEKIDADPTYRPKNLPQ